MECLFNGLGLDLEGYGEFLRKVAQDQGIGEAVQEAFIQATEQAGVGFG
jgi:hypothetical protein